MQASAFAATGISFPARSNGFPIGTHCASGLHFRIDQGGDVRPSTARAVVKRGMDITLAAAALLILSPVLLVLALLIKLTSPGPALFIQQRPGRNGRLFPMLKFRTMHVHLEDRTGFIQATDNDPRVTQLGRFLRRTSLDELPQLINILLGQMSLVGPRPHPVRMLAGGMDYENLVSYYHQRLAIRPGLSGWAQVNGLRGPTTDAGRAIARIDHDLAYIQNRSILLDVRIILRTLVEVLRGSGC
jgi:lipopolysaccharide/colanic/teichoic acid biosynthesis glycosyltransferase